MDTHLTINVQKTEYPMLVYDAREEGVRRLLVGGARLASSPAKVARRRISTIKARRPTKFVIRNKR